MEKKMNCNLILSLKEICFRRVVVIWYTRRFTVASDDLPTKCYVIHDMRNLGIPPLLTDQMTYVVDPIKTEIIEWIFFHASYLGFSYDNLEKYVVLLCWTNLGAVDYRKSAKNLIHYGILDIVQRYKLACLYCLDDHISALWEKLPEESKKYFYKEEGPMRGTRPSLEFCWPYILKGEETKLNRILEGPMGNFTTFNQYAFEYSAGEGNKAATEYFLKKLTNAEGEVSLFRTVEVSLQQLNDIDVRIYKKETLPKRSDTFCYLLSLMSSERQSEIFQHHPFNVLKNFIDWPWQDISLDITELIWPYLTAEEYATALEMISMRIKSGFNLTKVFRELFLHGNSDFRKQFVDQECLSGVSFRSFFKVKDSETIKIVFRAVDSEDRKRLVFSECVLKHFYKSILRQKCNMVQLCFQESTLSNEDKEGLKDAFFGFFTEIERRNKIRESRLRNELYSSEEDEEEQHETLTETELDPDDINRRNYIWEQFLLIVDKDTVKSPCTSWFDEDMWYLSSDSEY